MIVEKEVPYAYGVTSMPINGGSMTNQGIEVSVGRLFESKIIFPLGHRVLDYRR